MSSFRFLLLLLLSAAAEFATAPSLRAEAELSLSQGIFSVVVIDNGVGDTNPALGAITFTGPVGDFSGTFNAGTTKPFIGSALQPQLGLISTAISTHAQGGTLTILFGDTGFGPVANGNVTAQIGGTSPVSGSVSYQTFMDTGNLPLGLSVGLTSQQALSGAIFDNATGNASFGPNTSITQQVIVTQGPDTVTGLNSTLRVSSALVTPDNGSAVVMLAAALIAVELFRSRLQRRFD